MHLLASIQPLIHQFGYFGVGLILFLENTGIPFPAETTLILAGIEWKQGIFSFIPLVLSAIIGNFLGSIFAYTIGRYLGRPFLLRFQKLFRLNDAILDKAQGWLLKAKIPVLSGSKFIAGIRIIVPYLAGINRLPFSQFVLWGGIGTCLWAVVFLTFGQTLALLINQAVIFVKTTPYLSIPLLSILLLGVVILVIWIKRRRKRKKEKECEKETQVCH